MSLSFLQGPGSIPESSGLDSRASGDLRGSDCEGQQGQTHTAHFSQEFPQPLLMWTLASTLPLQPLTLTILQLSREAENSKVAHR